ncbi:hypothetical protein [Fibrella arboris]|uniref:hypothetical protein n=1 Tax=Fibrella arboris TaxID=3242486 RepID=UPI0035213ACA
MIAVIDGHAQLPYVPAKNAIQLGADYLGVDPANGLKYRFAFDYRRYTTRDRLSLGLTVGFMNSQRTTVLIPDYVSVGTNTRRRVTVDLTAAYNVLHSVHHALRLGAGPALWYGSEDLFVKVDPYPVPSGTPIDIVRRQTEGWRFGGQVSAEYTYALALNTQVSVHAGGAVVGPSGLVPLFGFRAGYRF